MFNENTGYHRTRRGLFNFVGSLHNFLWGTLDQNYAKEMSATIDKVKANEDELIKLIKTQTSIIESTKNLIKKTDQDIKDQFDSIGAKLNELSKTDSKLHLGGQRP